MKKYLEYFDGAFDSTVAEKVKPENKPYVAYSKTDGVVYTVIPRTNITAYQMVDLGLPSGTLWADRNVGASSPEDAGLYFQWGDTVGYTAEQVAAGEKVFNWDSYFDSTDGGSTFNKYATDKLTVLEPSDDAAYVHMGSGWRIPSKNDMIELYENSFITFIDLQGNEYSKDDADNGVIKSKTLKGVRLTSNINGNSIFIPAVGKCFNNSSSQLNSAGFYWYTNMSKYTSQSAGCFEFVYSGQMINSSVSLNSDTIRSYGISVRGVQNPS